MALTLQERKAVMFTVVGTFNASPGRTIFEGYAEDFINGASHQEITADLVATPLFEDAYPPFLQTNEEFALEYIGNLMGARDTLVEGSLWDAVVDLTVSWLEAAVSKADTIWFLTQYMSGTYGAVIAGLEDAAQALENKVDVALYQAVNLELDIPATSLEDLRAPIADVDETQQSVDDAIAALDSYDDGEITDTVGAPGGSVDEDAELGAAVGVEASANFVNDVSYSLTDDAGGLFAIDEDTGVVTVAGALDREAAASHDITVQADNGDGDTTSADFTISLGEVNDNDVSAIDDEDGAPNTVSENGSAGDLVGIDALATDADVGATSISYSLSDDAGGKFQIDSDGVVTTTGSLDREAEDNHNITVVATSDDGSSNSRTFNILVDNVNEGPDATGTDLATIQDTPVDGSITATDPENDDLTYVLTTPASDGSVNLNGDGTFTYVPNDGFAGDDSFAVTVTDGNGGFSSPALVTVSVGDIADVLTIGVDNVLLSGAAQVVTGNHLTYNPGDIIAGEDGAGNTLHLGLTPTAPITLGSATVTGIDNLLVNVNPADPSHLVTLLMTLWGPNSDTDPTHALDLVSIVQSLGTAFSILDLQNLATTSLNDLAGMVSIDVDHQVVAGGSDELDIILREVGTNSSSTGGRTTILTDNSVEILNITDDSLNASFASDLTVLANIGAGDNAGPGFDTVMIDGGITGVALTIQDTGSDDRSTGQGAPSAALSGFSSLAGTTITVDSTGFAGNLVADIDGAATGVVSTGVGADSLIAHSDSSATISTGMGADVVLLSGSGTDLISGSISGGGGADNLRVEGGLFSSSIDGGDAGDTIYVGTGVDGGSTILGGSGNDGVTIATGGVAGSVQGDDGADTINIWGGITGVVGGGLGNDTINQNTDGAAGRVTGIISGGEDDDTIYNEGILGDRTFVGDSGTINGDSGAGNDTITQADDMEDGSAINGGGGDDTIVVGTLGAGHLVDGDLTNLDAQSGAVINGDDGNDDITIHAVLDGDVNGGSGNDTVTFTDNHREGSVNLGDGDDEIVYLNGGDFTGDIESGPADAPTSNDGSADGGTGTNSVTMLTGQDDMSHSMEIASDGTDGTAAPFDGTDFINFQTLNLRAVDLRTSPGNTEHDQLFQVDMRAFDNTLGTVNVLDDDKKVTVELDGYNGEQINWDSDGDGDQTLNILDAGDLYLTGGPWLTGAATGATSSTLNLALASTDVGGEDGFNAYYNININDDLDIATTNLTNNSGSSRDVTLDGLDQDNNGGTAGEGNSLNIDGDNTSRLRVFNSTQETVDASAYSGNLYLEVIENENHSIVTTAQSNDWVDMTPDTVNLGDTVDLGDGSGDRLVIANSTRTLSLVDDDQFFEGVAGMDILRAAGDDGGTLLISIEDDFRAAGSGGVSQTIEVTNNGGTAGNVDIDIDADYLDDHPDPANAHLAVEVLSGVVDIDNGADVDLTVHLVAQGTTSLFSTTYNTTSVSGAGAGATFTQTGNGDVNVDITVARTVSTVISSTLLAAPSAADPSMVGHVGIDVTSGSISPNTITLLDVVASGGSDNGDILMTWDRGWSSSGLDFNVNAAGIENDDLSHHAGFTKDDDGTNTGGLTFIGVAETDHGFALEGTQNDDVLWGGQDDDHINGNDGDDEIWGDPAIGQVVLPGVQGVKTVDYELADVVEAGDAYTIEIGGRTWTWTAASDGDTVQDAVTALTSAINGGSPAQVTAAGNIDDADNSDDVAALDLGDGTIEITGTGIDPVFGYALGEDFTGGSAINRPTTTVTIVSELYDVGDMVSITIDDGGGPVVFTATVVAGPPASTAASLAADLVGQINGGASGMTATDIGGGGIELRGDTAAAKYAVSSSWTVDQMDVPAAPNVVTITYTDLEAGETASVSFGGITHAAATTAGLEALILADPALAAWTPDGTSVPGTLTLTSVVLGSAPTLPAVTAADIAGGDGGTAVIGSVAGTDFIDRTDNTDPSLSARAVCFDLADAMYDGGDAVVVTIDTIPYTFTLVGPATEDPNLDGTAAAAEILAGAFVPPLPAGFTVTTDGASQVTITSADATVSSWAVSITDVNVNGTDGPSPEINEIDYTTFAATPGSIVSLTIGATTYTEAAGVDVEATLTALAAQVGGEYTGSYDHIGNPGVVVITSDASGVEPVDSVDAGTVSGSFFDPADVIIDQNLLGAVLVPATQVLDFAGITLEDGATVDFGGTPTINVPDSGSITNTLNALVAAIEAQTGWNATLSGATEITITSNDDLAAAEGYATANGVLTDIDDLVYSAPVPGSAAVPTTWTVDATTFDDAPGGNSISVTFDVSLDGADGPGDFSVSANTYQELVDNINASLGTIGPGISGAELGVDEVIIHGLATGIDNVPTVDIIAIAADGANGTIGASVSAATAAVAPVEWSQDIALPAALAAGTIVFVEISDGELIEVTLPGGADPANANAVATALENYFDLNGGVDTATSVALDNVTITITAVSPDPNNPTDPTISIANVNPDGNEPYTDASAAPADIGVDGTLPDPALIELDFTVNGINGQVLQVTLAAGLVYQGVGATIGDAALDLAANINLDTGTHGWVADGTVAANFFLTGPLNGTPPSIAFVSAELTTLAVVAETQESWENFDNTDPTLEFVSGLDNTDPDVAVVTPPVAAETAGANGNDVINGGIGEDTINGMGGSDTLNGDDGDDEINGGSGGDLINGGNDNDELHGNDGNDVVNGDSGNDTLTGDSGTDSLTGGDGNDSLMGGTGADTLEGGSGSDFLDGGRGASRDILTGGESADGARDTFRFESGDSTGQAGAADLITDFEAGPSGSHDVIQLDLVGVVGTFFANVDNTTDLLLALNNGGPAAGRTVYDTSAGMLYIDVGGTGDVNAAMSVEVDIINGGTLTANNFAFNAI